MDVTNKLFLFGFTDFQYDQFQQLDLRNVLGGGLGYHVIKNETTTFDVYGGGGFDQAYYSTPLTIRSGVLPLGDTLPFALVLLVASVPAALPATFTLAQALGAQELAHRGVLVTRLWYIREVDPYEKMLTGMTRDGTFRIRDGRVAEPLVNLRFTVAMPELLADVPALTRAVTLVNASDFYGERYGHGTLVPAIATGAFNVTGVGSAPGL